MHKLIKLMQRDGLSINQIEKLTPVERFVTSICLGPLKFQDCIHKNLSNVLFLNNRIYSNVYNHQNNIMRLRTFFCFSVPFFRYCIWLITFKYNPFSIPLNLSLHSTWLLLVRHLTAF